jgi:hypothetical protein
LAAKLEEKTPMVVATETPNNKPYRPDNIAPVHDRGKVHFIYIIVVSLPLTKKLGFPYFGVFISLS